MALNSNRLTQDQNFRSNFDGVKTNGSIAQKNRGGLGGRKTLNDDTSHSGKPSALQPSRKHNTMNVIPIAEDLGVSKKSSIRVSGRKALTDLTNSAKPSVQGKGKQSITVAEDENFPYSIAEEGFLHDHEQDLGMSKKPRSHVSGRKALTDLTNSVKPSAQKQQQQQGVKKKIRRKQSVSVVAEDENWPSIAEGCFLHDHEKCIQSQKEAMALPLPLDDHLWMTLGLDEDSCLETVTPLPRQSISKPKEENLYEMLRLEETPTPIFEIEDEPDSGHNSPICFSLNSRGLPFENSTLAWTLVETP